MAGKSDMERLGVFSELGYTTVVDLYFLPNSKPFSERVDDDWWNQNQLEVLFKAAILKGPLIESCREKHTPILSR